MSGTLRYAYSTKPIRSMYQYLPTGMILSSIAKPTAGRIAPTRPMPATNSAGMAFCIFSTVSVLRASAARKVGIARTAAHGMKAVQCIKVMPDESPFAA